MWGNLCQRACSHDLGLWASPGRMESFLASIDLGNHDENEISFQNMDFLSVELKRVSKTKKTNRYVLSSRTRSNITDCN